MLERATVISAHDGRVDVAIRPSAACASCGACSEEGDSRHLSDVADPIGAHVGDIVEVHTPARARRRAQGLVYIAPVASILLGYLAGFLLSSPLGVDPDLAGAVLGLLAGAAVLWFLRVVDRKTAGSDRYESRVRAIISRGPDTGCR